jgi:hypothetical protein
MPIKSRTLGVHNSPQGLSGIFFYLIAPFGGLPSVVSTEDVDVDDDAATTVELATGVRGVVTVQSV